MGINQSGLVGRVPLFWKCVHISRAKKQWSATHRRSRRGYVTFHIVHALTRRALIVQSLFSIHSSTSIVQYCRYPKARAMCHCNFFEYRLCVRSGTNNARVFFFTWDVWIVWVITKKLPDVLYSPKRTHNHCGLATKIMKRFQHWDEIYYGILIKRGQWFVFSGVKTGG